MSKFRELVENRITEAENAFKSPEWQEGNKEAVNYAMQFVDGLITLDELRERLNQTVETYGLDNMKYQQFVNALETHGQIEVEDENVRKEFLDYVYRHDVPFDTEQLRMEDNMIYIA